MLVHPQHSSRHLVRRTQIPSMSRAPFLPMCDPIQRIDSRSANMVSCRGVFDALSAGKLARLNFCAHGEPLRGEPDASPPGDRSYRPIAPASRDAPRPPALGSNPPRRRDRAPPCARRRRRPSSGTSRGRGHRHLWSANGNSRRLSRARPARPWRGGHKARAGHRPCRSGRFPARLSPGASSDPRIGTGYPRRPHRRPPSSPEARGRGGGWQRRSIRRSRRRRGERRGGHAGWALVAGLVSNRACSS
jgi:hypothetical protein